MALLTNNQLSIFYANYKDIEVSFSKGVIQATGIMPRHTYLKCLGDQWPCVILSTSMAGAKILVNITDDFYKIIQKANNLISLRFSFKNEDRTDPLSFYVSARIMASNPYRNQENLTFITMAYTQRPPDDLIGILGNLLETNINSKKRKDVRIILNNDSVRKLGLVDKSANIRVDNIPRKAVLRDISFSGMQAIIMGVPKFLVEKQVQIQMILDDNKGTMTLSGKILRSEAVEGRKGLAVIAIQFTAELPIELKMKINDHIRSMKVQETKKKIREQSS